MVSEETVPDDTLSVFYNPLSEIIDSSMSVVSAYGRSIGFPIARAQTTWAVNPIRRLTPNRTV